MRFFKKEKVGRKRICYLFGIKVLSYSRGGGIMEAIYSMEARLKVVEFNTLFTKELLVNMNKDNLNSYFDTIYKTGAWVNGSGDGSDENLCAGYVAFLQDFFKRHNIKSIVDCGCGDWQFSKNIDFSGIDYKGFDVANFVIERNNATYKKDNVNFSLYNGDFSLLPSADLLLCKDVLQHLPNAKIQEFIDNLHKFKFALITNDIGKSVNVDIVMGCRSIDLRQEPFNLHCELVFTIARMPKAPDIGVMLWINQ